METVDLNAEITPVLRNKVVKVNNLQLLHFFLPDYTTQESISSFDLEKNVIYIGPYSADLSQRLFLYTKSFVSITGIPEVDLRTPQSLFEFVYSKHQKKTPKAAATAIPHLQPFEVERIAKIVWVNGSYPFPKSDNGSTFFDLYLTLLKTPKDFLQTYNSLLVTYAPESIESALLTFLQRVLLKKEQKVSIQYKALLDDADRKFGAKIRHSLMKVYSVKGLNSNLRVISLYFELSGK